MLIELNIENFAVIENINLRFREGLNVLSGEEGSGKSLIVDALGILLGTKAPTKLIRTGKDYARVEGIFSLSETVSKEIHNILKDIDISPESDGSLVISREFNLQGRSISKVNGRATTTTQLRNISKHLVDIHEQLDNISLIDPHHQLTLLDSFGNLDEQKNILTKLIDSLREKNKQLSSLYNIKSNGRLDLLRYQIDEIERINIRPGEEQDLQNRLILLQNAESLKSNLNKIYNNLYGEDRSSTALIYESLTILRNIKITEPKFINFLEKLENCLLEIEDIARECASYMENIEVNTNELEEIELRINQINSLKRKYGNTFEDIYKYRDEAINELNYIENAQLKKQQLQEEIENLRIEAGKIALILSARRKECAAELSKIVNQELSELGLPFARYEISVTQEEDLNGLPTPDNKFFSFTREGIDNVEFMISTNPGEPLRPLRTIVSGGETSRIMLAIKSALKKVDPIPTLVFDEIDAGIGGRNADSIGKKLSSLSQKHQVICITHLPQIACYADQHIRLNKQIILGQTFTKIESIKGHDRVKELAAMLGASTIDDPMIKGAEKLVNNATLWKKNRREATIIKK